MLVKTEAIVLHSLKYGETRLIVDLFTREAGRLSCIVPLPKTPRSRLKKQYFQPMTLLEVEIDLRQRLQLQKMKDARLLSAYATIPFSPEKLALSLFVAEFLYHALRSEQKNEHLFAYICDSMQWLDIAEKNFANFSLLIPTHRDFLQPDDARRIHTLMRMDFPTMHLYRLNRTDRNRIVDVLLRYYSLHIPQFPELKSLSVLQELWAE